MANYLATDADFIRVANAIRTKGGTSAQLAWPEEFISAIMAIPTDGKTYVDVCLFAGQSNMDGRGDSSEAPTTSVKIYLSFESLDTMRISLPNCPLAPVTRMFISLIALRLSVSV